MAESLEIVDLMDSHCCKIVVTEGASAFCMKGGVVDIMDSAEISVAATREEV